MARQRRNHRLPVGIIPSEADDGLTVEERLQRRAAEVMASRPRKKSRSRKPRSRKAPKERHPAKNDGITRPFDKQRTYSNTNGALAVGRSAVSYTNFVNPSTGKMDGFRMDSK